MPQLQTPNHCQYWNMLLQLFCWCTTWNIQEGVGVRILVDLGRTSNGERIRRGKYFDAAAECRTCADEILVKHKIGVNVLDGKQTLKAFIDTSLLAQPNKETTKTFNNRTIPLFIEDAVRIVWSYSTRRYTASPFRRTC